MTYTCKGACAPDAALERIGIRTIRTPSHGRSWRYRDGYTTACTICAVLFYGSAALARCPCCRATLRQWRRPDGTPTGRARRSAANSRRQGALMRADRMARPDRACALCGTTIPGHALAYKRYCTRACEQRSRKGSAPLLRAGRTCRHCAAPIPFAAHGHRRFCDQDCHTAFHVAARRVRKRRARGPRACLQCATPLPTETTNLNRQYCRPCAAARRIESAIAAAHAYRRRRRQAALGTLPVRTCANCQEQIPRHLRADAKFCGAACRSQAGRLKYVTGVRPIND